MGVDLERGAVVAGRYALDQLLGEGGMGTVWSATHLVTKKAVALKLLKQAHAQPDARRRFLREARAATQVAHPNVREVTDIFELEDGAPVMVMELLVGESLADRLARQSKLSLDEAVRVLQPVISAVGAAHALGVIHRDLKPANIFLSSRGGPVKVLDFGVAKLTSNANEETLITKSGAAIGTPCYMAPEQVFGEPDLDHRVDVWALGMILYQALTGELPTRAENVGQVMKLIVTRAIPSVRTRCPELPEPFTALVDRMLERARADRVADLREVRRVLATIAKDSSPGFEAPRGVSEAPHSLASEQPIAPPTNRDGAATISSAKDPSDARGVIAKPARSRLRAAPLAAVIVVTLAAAGFIVSRAAVGREPVNLEPKVAVSAPAPSVTAAVSKVRLAINPSDATVHVDGVPTAVTDGAVEVVGAIGSKHEVRLARGPATRRADVVITTDGPFPSALHLEPQPSASAPRPVAPPQLIPAKAVAATPSSSAPTPFQAAEKFE
jgi:serine/threonine-protein kinase